MITLQSIPRSVRWTVPLGLIGLALTVPFSAPDGSGMQWDEAVLGGVAASSAWAVVRLIRTMDARAALPWRIVGVAALLFMTAQWLTAAFPGPQLDGFGLDDVLLFAGACAPLITCALLARRVRRTRSTALVVDGLIITVALLTVTEVLRTPLVNPAGAPDDLRSLVLAYGGYAAVMLGGGAALCTVSTAALRRSASIMMGAVGWQALAACAEAMAIIEPSWVWTATSDVAVALGMQTVVVAASFAPRRRTKQTARDSAPQVSRLGLLLVVGAMLSLPIAIAVMEVRGEPHPVAAEAGFAVVFTLMALRLVLRVREDGRVTADLVRSEDDFRELIEASSDGIAIMDGDFRLLFTSPAARSLLGLDSDTEDDVSLLDLVDPADRDKVHAATVDVAAGEGPPLHFRVVGADGSARDLEAISTERPGSGRRVLYLRDVTTRRSRERELERMAYTDHLTGLPNRAMLFGEMATAADHDRCLVVLDLDGFKAVNDVAGHEAGDQLLVEVARRLHTVVREDDLVARLGGDEFAVLVAGSLVEAEDVAQRIVHALSVPHRTSDWTFAIGASAGVSALGAAGGQLAFREADAALRAAKQSGKGCVRLANVADSPFVVPDAELGALVDEGMLHIRLDAACDADGRIAMLHAVPVWQHVLHGTVRGAELWTAAERQGRSAELQGWLLRQACLEIAGLDDRISVAVSLPAGHVHPDGLAGEVEAALAGSGLAPSRLILSFTEETLLTGSAALIPELEATRCTGVRLCLDNFGMGHSLYALLARIPLDMVRVDLAALASRDDTDRALQVLAAIVGTTAGFGLTAIAGGISAPELRDAVLATGVDLLQGRGHHDLTAGEVAALRTVPAV
ncbi:diguanylate cyclase domain-containing protein [Blastococcus mobilis]|uniref:PAS domain S-box-containing protein/diguanylate cyclase (GGDEF) domain-containing protein n=1 Tax=Blastococcus mobilis TaxID=1938746 RepID=A0A238WHF7_9ACTN|nr:diguanylate cyclase [Blastococcus mobilis]SNR45907.1 PAS domain S-box-containing protein/diguanylate cyclase (GGDEF) domain-containing protein [Blastococcus mobilis]